MGLDRCGDSDDAKAVADVATDFIDDQRRGGPGAEADGHTFLHLGCCPLRGATLGRLGRILRCCGSHAHPSYHAAGSMLQRGGMSMGNPLEPT
jgi:hypothetical protein